MIPQEILRTPLASPMQARAYLRGLLRVDGFLFHPDDSASCLVVYATGEPIFSELDGVLYDQRMEEVFHLLADPYSICLELMDEET